MKIKIKKANTKFIIVLVVCTVYFFLSIKIMTTEVHLTPDWTEDISRVKAVGAEENLIPYRLGQNLGYFTETGTVASNYSFPFKSAISEDRYAFFNASNTSCDFYSVRGEKQGVIKESGFPYFDENRIYVFLPGGTSFVRCNESGERLWKYESYSPITAFASSSAGTCAGYADGTVISLDNEGRLMQKFSPGGSEIEVILGVDISEDGNKIACVSGVNRQRFIFAERNGIHSKVVYHDYMETSLTRQTIVKFNKKATAAYYNYDGGLGIVDGETARGAKIPVKGKILQIEFSDTNDLVFVLSKDGNRFHMTVVEPFNHPVARFTFNGTSSFLQVRGDKVFIGCDTKISCLSVNNL